MSEQPTESALEIEHEAAQNRPAEAWKSVQTGAGRGGILVGLLVPAVLPARQSSVPKGVMSPKDGSTDSL